MVIGKHKQFNGGMMKKLGGGKLLGLSGMVMALAIVCCLADTTNASAATINWVGGTTGKLTDWDEPNNWDTKTVPGADDDVVIDTTGDVKYGPYLSGDIAVHSITGISDYILNLDNDPSAEAVKLEISGSLSGVRVGGFDSQLEIVATGETLDMENIRVEHNATLDLNGKTVNIAGLDFSQPYKGKSSKITGDGVLNLSDYKDAVAENKYGLNEFLGMNNDYTGTTNINDIYYFSVGSLNAFGDSDVNINNSRILWELWGEYSEYGQNGSFDGKSINNKFTINGQPMNGTLVSPVFEFYGPLDEQGITEPAIIKIPNIVLNSNAKFDVTMTRIDMTGIQANGHCMDLRVSDDTKYDLNVDEWFIGHPTVCTIKSNGVANGAANDNKYPGAPAAGWLAKNPLVVAVAGLGIAGLIALVTRSRRAKAANV